MRLWKKVDSFERWLFLVSQISGVFFHVEIRGTLKYLPVPAAPKLIFRYQLNATSIFSCGFSWVELDQIKKIFKKIGIASLKCFVTSNMMAFGQKNSTEHLIKCLHSLNHGHSLSEAKFVSKQQRGMPQMLFFSVANLPSFLNDWKISVPKPKPKMDIYKYHQIVTSKRIKKH